MATRQFKPKRSSEQRTLQVRVPSEQDELVRSLATQFNCKVSEIVRHGLHWAIDDLTSNNHKTNPDENPGGVRPAQIFDYDSQNLARSVMDLVELEASRRTGSASYPMGPYLFKEEADSLLPGFDQTLREAITLQQVPEELQDRMHDHVDRLAQEVLQEMTKEDFESLVQAAEKHIKSRLASP